MESLTDTDFNKLLIGSLDVAGAALESATLNDLLTLDRRLGLLRDVIKQILIRRDEYAVAVKEDKHNGGTYTTQ